MMLSINLQEVQVNDIEQKFATNDESPFKK